MFSVHNLPIFSLYLKKIQVKRIYVPLPDENVRRLLLKNQLKGQAFSLPGKCARQVCSILYLCYMKMLFISATKFELCNSGPHFLCFHGLEPNLYSAIKK